MIRMIVLLVVPHLPVARVQEFQQNIDAMIVIASTFTVPLVWSNFIDRTPFIKFRCARLFMFTAFELIATVDVGR